MKMAEYKTQNTMCKISCEPYADENRQLLRPHSGEVAVTIENSDKYEAVKKEHNKLRNVVQSVTDDIRTYCVPHSSNSPEVFGLAAEQFLAQPYPLLGIGRPAKVFPEFVEVLDLLRRFFALFAVRVDRFVRCSSALFPRLRY